MARNLLRTKANFFMMGPENDNDHQPLSIPELTNQFIRFGQFNVILLKQHAQDPDLNGNQFLNGGR